MDHLLLLEPVKVLEGENIHKVKAFLCNSNDRNLIFQLLTIFVSGRLQDYLEFYSKEKSFIESSGMKRCSLFVLQAFFVFQG